jgi:hypothetical protein
MLRSNSDNTLGGRLASAAVTLTFSLPLCALYWLVINYYLAGSDAFLSVRYLVGFIAIMGIIGFAFPKFSPSLFGWLCEIIFRAG